MTDGSGERGAERGQKRPSRNRLASSKAGHTASAGPPKFMNRIPARDGAQVPQVQLRAQWRSSARGRAVGRSSGRVDYIPLTRVGTLDWFASNLHDSPAAG